VHKNALTVDLLALDPWAMQRKWHHDTKPNDTPYNDTQHEWLICGTQYNNALPL
jgi:hypothetical protein